MIKVDFTEVKLTTRLAPNFLLREFLVSEHVSTDVLLERLLAQPNAYEILQNLYVLAQRLQSVRDYYQNPVIITSGYRDAALNSLIGGAAYSTHMKGQAVDIIVVAAPANRVQRDFSGWYGGLGAYESYTHLDIRGYPMRW